MSPPSSPFLARFALRLFSILAWLTALAAAIWAFLALTVAFPIPALRWPVAAGLSGLCLIASLRLGRRPFAPSIAIIALVAPVFLWWLTLTPRNDRRWQPDMEKIPAAEIAGDVITLHNFRNTQRRALDDFTTRWETRTFHFSALKHLDLYMVYWGSPHICHTMMSFDFGPEGRVCASIEARREQDEEYSPLAGAFRRYELMYVLGEERDLVRRRASLGGDEQTYLFRVSAPPEVVRAIFLDYLKSANALQRRPAWYHSLTSNCSTLIREHVKPFRRYPLWDWRVIANGHMDKLLYADGFLDRSLPLSELKARSLINPVAHVTPDAPDFSDRIRSGLPGF